MRTRTYEKRLIGKQALRKFATLVKEFSNVIVAGSIHYSPDFPHKPSDNAAKLSNTKQFKICCSVKKDILLVVKQHI